MDNKKPENNKRNHKDINPFYKIQGKKLENALYYIKAFSREKSDKEILLELQTDYEVVIDTSYLSKMKSGEKPIKEELVNCLKEKYNINPEYILGESESLLDTLSINFDNFCSIANNWMTISQSKTSQKYNLLLEMDDNLYRFLLQNPRKNLLYTGKEFSFEDTIIYTRQQLRCKKPDYQRYILIPEEDVINTNEDSDLKLFETKLSLLEKDYKSLEERVKRFEEQKAEEVDKMVSETHEKIKIINDLIGKLNKHKKIRGIYTWN